jgi:hypothetical protein
VGTVGQPVGNLVRKKPLDIGDFSRIGIRNLVGAGGVKDCEFPGGVGRRRELVESFKRDVLDAQFLMEFSGRSGS